MVKVSGKKNKNLIYKLMFIIEHYHCDFRCDMLCFIFQSVKRSNRVLNGVSRPDSPLALTAYVNGLTDTFTYLTPGHTHTIPLH